MTSERVGNGKKWSQRVRPGPRLQKHLERLLTVLICVCVCERETERDRDRVRHGGIRSSRWYWLELG